MTKNSKTKDIAKYLANHKRKGLTQKEAADMFGAYRLSSIVYYLKYSAPLGQRMHIRSEHEFVKNRSGSASNFVRYFFDGYVEV